MIVADFQSEYGIRLRAELDTLTWVDFRDLLRGLLASETRLWRQFRPETEPDASAGQ